MHILLYACQVTTSVNFWLRSNLFLGWQWSLHCIGHWHCIISFPRHRFFLWSYLIRPWLAMEIALHRHCIISFPRYISLWWSYVHCIDSISFPVARVALMRTFCSTSALFRSAPLCSVLLCTVWPKTLTHETRVMMHVMNVVSWRLSHGFRVMDVKSWLSCHAFRVMTVMSHDCHLMDVNHECRVMNVVSWLSCPNACHDVLPVTFCLRLQPHRNSKETVDNCIETTSDSVFSRN